MIIEDNERLAQSLQDLLKQIWFDADICTDGITGACQMETGAYDLGDPGSDASGKGRLFPYCRRPGARGVQTRRCCFLQPAGEVEDKVRGLEGRGADYYLTKPL